MLSPQEITRESEKLSTTMNKARELGNELTSTFSELDRAAAELTSAGMEMNIRFTDKPELQAAWHIYKHGNELPLPQVLRTASG